MRATSIIVTSTAPEPFDLTRSPGTKELLTFSPDGKFVAFVRDNNLFVVDVATQTERALTTDGSAAIFNGKADWVYFEEIYNRNHQAFWWSPDSSRIVFLRFDDTPVRKLHAGQSDRASANASRVSPIRKPARPTRWSSLAS